MIAKSQQNRVSDHTLNTSNSDLIDEITAAASHTTSIRPSSHSSPTKSLTAPMPPIIMEEADGEEAELKQLQSNNGKGCHLWALLKSDQAKLKIKELVASKGNLRLRSLWYGT